jgi:glycogen debranching enzyme
VLSVDLQAYYRAVYFLALATGTVYVDSHLTVVRKRWVGVGFHEDLTLTNHDRKPVDLEVRLEAGADFADLFEVKDKLKKKGELYRRVVEQGQLTLGYRREHFCRETHITSSAPAEATEEGFMFKVHLEPQGQWSTCLDVSAVRRPVANAKPQLPRKHDSNSEVRPELAQSLDRWLEDAPKVSTTWEPLTHIFRRSLVDLAALRFSTPFLPGALPAAGLPWFMAIFGRDSLLTSFQSLPFVPELTRTTLKTLALVQARRDDPYRDAEPGKIVHELRRGELTAFEEVPQSP